MHTYTHTLVLCIYLKEEDACGIAENETIVYKAGENEFM